MKIISLIGPAILENALRHPSEGRIIVSDEEAERLQSESLLYGEPEEAIWDEPAGVAVSEHIMPPARRTRRARGETAGGGQ